MGAALPPFHKTLCQSLKQSYYPAHPQSRRTPAVIQLTLSQELTLSQGLAGDLVCGSFSAKPLSNDVVVGIGDRDDRQDAAL